MVLGQKKLSNQTLNYPICVGNSTIPMGGNIYPTNTSFKSWVSGSNIIPNTNKCDYCGKHAEFIFDQPILYKDGENKRIVCGNCIEKANKVIIKALDKKFGKQSVFANRL